jgi:peptidyl-prolyl cis-trans isomerase D
MLQKIRDKVTGWFAVAIVAALIVPFAFWGIDSYFTGGSEPNVAVVNDTDIKLNQFQRAYTNYRQQMQSILGNRPLEPADEELLKEQTLEMLIDSELLNQVAREFRLTASDEQVRETIKSIDVFKAEGGFSKEFYQRAVGMLGMPPAVYEEQMRLDMVSEQLQTAIVESEFASRQAAEYAARLANQERDVTYIIIPAEKFIDSIEVNEEQVEQFYNENPGLYIKPEEVKIAYIHLSLDHLANAIEINEDDLRAYYENNRAKYDMDEQRQITQILLKVEEGSSDDVKEAVKSEARKILEKIRAGQTFTDIAKEYAENKEFDFTINEYGFLDKGILQPEVDEVVYSMQKDEISDVIQSKLGIHIVELKGIKGGVMNTFENSRADVEKDYRRKQAEQHYFDLADRLANSSYEHPDTLEIASEETELPVQESELFSRDGGEEGLIANPEVVAASFSEDVLINSHNSELIELSDTEMVVLRVLERVPSARLPLEVVRDEIIHDIKFNAASGQAYELGQVLIAELEEGNDFYAISADREIEWQEAKAIKRSDVTVNRAVLRTVFRLGQPQNDKPVIGGISQGTGDYAVIAVTAVNDPAPDTIKGVEIENTQKQLQALQAEASWKQFLSDMKSSAKIRIFKERITDNSL